MKRIFLILALGLSVSAHAAWSDHYVTATGSDTYANSTNSSTPCSLTTAVAGYAAGDRINVKAGTYTISADLAFATAGTTTAPVWWRGYKTTPGDLDAAGGSRIPVTDLPAITSTNVTDQITSAGAHQIWSNIAVASTCTDANGAWSATGGNQRFIRCQIKNTTANTAARALSVGTNNPYVLIGTRLEATTTATIAFSVSATAHMIGGQIIGGVTACTASEYSSYLGVAVSGFGTSGFSLAGATRTFNVSDCTIYAAATNAILITTIPTSGYITISNNILGGCTNGVNNNTGGNTNGVTLTANHFYSCTNNIVGLAEQADVTADLTASLFNIDNDTDPFVAKASANFTLTATAVDRGAGYPGAFDSPAGTPVMTSKLSIGAVSPSLGSQVSYSQ